jgi:hypothetical protein
MKMSIEGADVGRVRLHLGERERSAIRLVVQPLAPTASCLLAVSGTTATRSKEPPFRRDRFRRREAVQAASVHRTLLVHPPLARSSVDPVAVIGRSPLRWHATGRHGGPTRSPRWLGRRHRIRGVPIVRHRPWRTAPIRQSARPNGELATTNAIVAGRVWMRVGGGESRGRGDFYRVIGTAAPADAIVGWTVDHARPARSNATVLIDGPGP